MKWLVVMKRTAAPASLQDLLGAAQASIAPGAEWIDLGFDEMTIEVEGPANLPDQLESDAAIKAVYPSSEPTPYR